jgi:nucleoside-diphosphate-sugar epimerase
VTGSVAPSVALTGAGGWLGTALTARLLADPSRTDLRLLAATTAEARHLEAELAAHAPRVTVVVGDVRRADTARRLLHGCAEPLTLVHTAGVIHPRRARDFYAVNAIGTRHVAHAALDAGVARLVHVSSNSPFGTNPDPRDTFRADEPFNPYLGYGWSKMHAEVAVGDAVAAGLSAVIVRPPWFYGPHQPARQTTFFRLVRTGGFPVIGAGEQRRSMVYIGNLVDGILCAERYAGPSGAGFWIADARPYTVDEIVDTVARGLRDEGYEVTPGCRRLPPIAAAIAERADRAIQRVGGYQQQLHVLGEMGHTIACDIGRSTEELGYVPAVELYDGMRESIRWCRANGIEL